LPTNWAATTPANGITREIVGTGTEDGIAYVDIKFSGTNTLGSNFYMDITFDSGTITAAQNQAWTESCYVKLVAGVITGSAFTTGPRLILYEVPGFASSSQLLSTATSDALVRQRFSLSRTLTDAATTAVSPRLAFNVATGGTIDFTLRIGLPQLEQNAFATSVISTSGSTATRAADVSTSAATFGNSWYEQDEGTVFTEARTQQSSSSHIVTGISTGSFSSSIYLVKNSGNGLSCAPAAAPSDLNIGLSNIYSNIPFSAGLAFTAGTGSASASRDGGAVVIDGSTGIPTTMSQMVIGSAPWAIGTSLWNGTINRITYWPTRLSNDTLQTITV